MNKERKSNRRTWVLAGLLGLTVWLVHATWPRDLGRELRYAVFQGDLATAEALLRAHPELVNLTFAPSGKSQPQLPRQVRPGAMNITDEFTMYLWGKFVMKPVTVLEGDKRFEAMEQEKLPPLHLAALKNDLKMTRMLLGHQADVRQKAWGGSEAIFYAAGANVDMVRLLLEHGASATATNDFGRTPLHHAVYDPKGTVARMLLAAGADPNAQDRRGWAPLHNASLNAFQTNVCALLLQHGARLDITNHSGMTPIDLALDRRLTNAVEFLSNWRGQKPAQP